ncbi:PAS domain-containing protein [Kineococcus sp. R8]|uniref:sensor histidine kinase n=1 Tax=Kineococcus siccus TaxID=2696567 RepID=UPI0014129BEC|nr:PAS domain-containing sensor histidine kinase [Kineococcus siccus]NAZ81059.1 PAS domain-containing protein [Kineococcus siccus]
MCEVRGDSDAAVAASPGPAPGVAAGPPPDPPRVALDDLPDGVVVVDADGRITGVNAAAEQLLGRSRADLEGTDVRRALPLQDTSGRRWWDAAEPVPFAPARSPGVVDGHPERMLLLPGGSELLVTARFVLRPGGGVERVVVQLRGTEERQRAESDAASLIATVAHELRSPLTSVKQFTATLLRRWDKFSDAQKRLMLSTVEADADRVTRLVGDLLDVSRVDAGRLQVHRRPLDLATLVREHVERLVLAGYDDDRFDLVVAGGLPELWADPDRMAQVVTNLVENAVRHGAGTVSLDIRYEPGAGGPGEVVLTVDDAGEGIAEENRPYVFSKFWHGGQRSGTGLGLYVVRGLLEAHGGSIDVARSPAGGARFRVRLPAGEPDAG